ncbi:phytanoyl-CoA dioxygenase family protein [Candidatus Poribacteria bacterium]|nr:phytanoyl-CoA dioxygenase family protein [Candidatus Poribacteria bacterium]
MLRLLPDVGERRDLRLSEERVREAARTVHEDGFVIMEGVIAPEHLDALREKMDADLQTLLTAKTLPVNFNRGHLQQDPPPFAPYVFRDVVANPFAVQVAREVFGGGFANTFYSGNTNLPGTEAQPVHADSGQLWKGMTVGHPPAQLVVNVVVEDVTERNGSVELWPGTHLIPEVGRGDDIKVDPITLEARRRAAPPVRGNLAKGDMLLRDIRLWHGGTPNRSDRPRQMIALIYTIGWMDRGRPLRFNKGCEAAFEDCGFDPNVEFTDEPIDYVFRNHPYDYAG